MTFREYLIEAGGETGWKMELVKTSLEDARDFAVPLFEKFGRDLYKEIPNFDENYLFAQKKAGLGKTKRKDMPVLTDDNLNDLEYRLKNGYIDVNNPFAKDNFKDPFPQGLSGKEADYWMQKGLEVHDGSGKDDKIKVTREKVKIGEIKPIQKQIYFDKSITSIAQFGAKASKDFNTKKRNFVVSGDNRLVDGHHSWLQVLLLDPISKVNVVKLHIPMTKLLPVTLSFSDASGNSRNV